MAAGAAAPAVSAGQTGDWQTVSAGQSHTCAIADTGRLYCWGANYWGQLGDGHFDTTGAPGQPSDADQAAPVEVVGDFTDWVAVSAGETFTCGIRSSHRLYCWGGNTSGALGIGSDLTTPHPTPQEVSGQTGDWVTVSAGLSFACALKTTGHLFCWGVDSFGQLGDGGTGVDQPSPVEVMGGSARWTSVTTGDRHTCATKTNGRAFCWGSNLRGQLGVGEEGGDVFDPREVAGRFTSWGTLSAGGDHSCGLRLSGRLFCWGDMRQGGDGGTEVERTVPSAVGESPNWTLVGAGTKHTCATRNSGRLYCWGRDAAAQLGDGQPNAAQRYPVQVAASETEDWSVVEGGRKHTCGVLTTGALYCWGSDVFGQLGDGGTAAQQATPALVAAP